MTAGLGCIADEMCIRDSGAPGVDTLFCVTWNEGIAKGRVAIPDLVRLLCENPAKCFGLYPRKGTLLPGSDADLSLIHISMKKTIRFLITGVGGQGTILASDILAEVGLRLGHDAKKSDILGLAVRGGSVVSHIIWGENVRAPMIDRGPADYYLSFEWLEGLRRLVYTNKDTVVLAND